MRIFICSLCILILLILSRCTKPEKEATESLLGNWKVDSLIILYTNKTPFGSSGTDSIWRSSGEIGSFGFTHESVAYDYTKRTVQQKANVNYTLRTFKENSGFTKVRKWEMILPERTYSVEFGDQTSDSYENAKNITLLFTPTEIGKQEIELIHLSKR